MKYLDAFVGMLPVESERVKGERGGTFDVGRLRPRIGSSIVLRDIDLISSAASSGNSGQISLVDT